MKSLRACIVFFAFVAAFTTTEAQQPRQRTRLELMFDDLVYNMGNMASRINAAIFSDNPSRNRRPRPPPPQHFQGEIDSFPEVTDVSNDIAFEPSRHTDDNVHAPNSPHFNSQSFQQFHAPNSPHAIDHHGHRNDANAQGTEEFQSTHQLPPEHHNHQQRFRRPRPPPRTGGGFDFRQFVNRAVDRVRNMWPSNRRRFAA